MASLPCGKPYNPYADMSWWWYHAQGCKSCKKALNKAEANQ